MGHPDLLHYSANEDDKRVRTTEKSPNALRTISEAAELIDVPQHVLRFWETKFSQIKPLKRNGGRRYYRPTDIEVLQQIKFLLYKQGYTIKGAKKAIDDLAAKRGDANPVVQDWSEAFPPANSNDNSQPEAAGAPVAATLPMKMPVVRDKAKLASLKDELMSLREELAPFIERSTAA